jgi:hypothetical protein
LGFWFEPTPTFYFTAETDIENWPFYRWIAIKNRRFLQISGVSLANLRKPTPTVSNESITRRSRFGTG